MCVKVIRKEHITHTTHSASAFRTDRQVIAEFRGFAADDEEELALQSPDQVCICVCVRVCVHIVGARICDNAWVYVYVGMDVCIYIVFASICVYIRSICVCIQSISIYSGESWVYIQWYVYRMT